ncbi:MAG: response regulator [Deltaproteobacteria bacterium]|nr:response regulator [Deltaproteobacteria bacterium]
MAAKDGEEALQYLNKNTPSFLILNMMMPRKTGGEVLKKLSNRSERFPILVVSGYVESKEQVSEIGQILEDRFEFKKSHSNGSNGVAETPKGVIFQD